jgi:uridine kinase
MSTEAFTSVSTWAQPEPAPASDVRTTLIASVARQIDAIGPQRLRVAVDGATAAGKTSFGHELASALRMLGRPTLRASLDDFKRPWSEAHLYDRRSGEGYYRNAQDFDAVVRLLLTPASANGDGRVALCSIDPITQQNHQDIQVTAPANAILVVDGVFAFRPEYNEHWDFRIHLDVDLEHSITRGVARDEEREGREEAERVHRDRYARAEAIYVAEVDPSRIADLVIDNRDFADPRQVKPLR